jgi:hypothetical protein
MPIMPKASAIKSLCEFMSPSMIMSGDVINMSDAFLFVLYNNHPATTNNTTCIPLNKKNVREKIPSPRADGMRLINKYVGP